MDLALVATAAAITTANSNAHKLKRFIEVSDSAFTALDMQTKIQKWWDVLGIARK